MHRYALLLFFDKYLHSVKNTVFLVSILEIQHYKLSMNSCIRYFFGLSYSILSVCSCKVNSSVGEYILKDGQL